MLEIFILIAMCKSLHKKASYKGHPGWIFVLSMVLSWLFLGVGLGVAGLVFFDSGDGEFSIGFVLGYLLGVVAACVGNYLLVLSLPIKDDSKIAEDADDERASIEQTETAGQPDLDTAKRAVLEAEDDGPIELTPDRPEGEAPPPKAKRAWQRKYGD